MLQVTLLTIHLGYEIFNNGKAQKVVFEADK